MSIARILLAKQRRTRATTRKKIRLKVISILFAMSPLALAEYLPPNGAEDLYTLISPTFFAGGVGAAQMERPQADVLNPSVSGFAQLPALDFSYTTLIDVSGSQGWGGHFLNLGGSHPTRAGVFNWSARFLYSRMESADLGFVGTGNLSFAKAIHENLLVGLGVGGGVCKNDLFDWALEGDAGFLHFLNKEGWPDLRWGVSLRDFGKTFKAATGRSAYPSPFTPAIGLGLTAVRTKNFLLDVSTDLSLPAFQNLRLTVGLRAELFRAVSASVSSTYDLRELLDPDIQLGSFIPGFGLAVRFGGDMHFGGGGGVTKGDFKLQTAAGPLVGDVWGFGLGINALIGNRDHEPPTIEIDYPEELILSFADGSKDELSFGLDMYDRRYIYRFSFVVENDSGVPVRTMGSDFAGLGGPGLRGFLRGLSYVQKSIEVPGSLAWDGRADNGDIVADGAYRFYVTATDDNGNTAVSNKYTVILDSTPPRISLKALDGLERIFSPNNDGNKDEIPITQEGSVEKLWTGIVLSDGKTVRTYSWENGSPGSFAWDGLRDDGTLATDGVYSYRISAVDEAGNSSAATLEEIVLDTQTTPIGLTINRSHFSPNGDGKLDDLVLATKVPITSGIQSWTVQIRNQAGGAVRKYGGASAPPETIVFDGRDDNGERAPDGRYVASLEVSYVNGNNPKTNSPAFVVDVTPPEANVTLDFTVFSPDGDGNKDVVTFFQETSVEEQWIGEIYNGAGLTIMSYAWRETADRTVTWDGHGHGGLIAPNGTYSYRLFAEDRAGNSGESREISFVLNTESATAFLSREYDAFSPNADGIRDVQRLFPQVSVKEGIDTVTFWILDKDQNAVWTYEGRQRLDDYYVWPGLADNGRRAPDGMYTARMEIRYLNGNNPVVNTRPFLVDTVFPTVSTNPDKYLFSPNGDGNMDTVTFRNSSGSEDLWEANIIDVRGNLIRKIFWKGRVSTFVWDGTDDAGNPVVDGEYFFEVSTTDAAGNYAVARSAGIKVDTRATSIYIAVSPVRFSPNGDGLLEDVTFSTIVNDKYGVESWTLTVMKSNGTLVRSFGGDRIPERIVWNGRTESGIISDGEYLAKFEVIYDMGNRPQAVSSPFYIDTVSPRAEISFKPVPFSPDGDRVDDLLELKVDIEDLSEIGRWSLTIVDPRGQLFRQNKGNGAPPTTIFWNGISAAGERVQSAEDYPFEFYVEDVVGNSTAFVDAIAVDVLVAEEKSGAKRITITNFSFAPNSPQLNTDEKQAAEKNEWILERIADICRKHSEYRVKIEGHAVSVYWDDPERAADEQEKALAPLSKARAETIKNALAGLGIDPGRIEIEGVGGARPAVPHGDLENRWKNRRIEFILYKTI